MITTYCAICGEKQNIVEIYRKNFNFRKLTGSTFSARRTPDRVHYRFVKCKNCGLIFSNPILEPEKIFSLYKKSGFTYQMESNYVKKTYSELLKKGVGNVLRHKSILDVGCGNGFFLEEARNLGIKDVWGIEPGRSSVEEAPFWLKKRIKINILKKGLFRRKFDVVTCFHTFDHVVDPNGFLKTTHSLLKKGGIALFIVHDTKGLSVKLMGERSPIFDIEHIYLFDKNSLRKIFRKNGFRKVEVFEVENKYPLEYWLRMISIPKKFKGPLLTFLDKFGLGKIPISLKAGNIGVLAVK